MITVANRIYVTPEYAEAFEQRFRERAGLVDTGNRRDGRGAGVGAQGCESVPYIDRDPRDFL